MLTDLDDTNIGLDMTNDAVVRVKGQLNMAERDLLIAQMAYNSSIRILADSQNPVSSLPESFSYSLSQNDATIKNLMTKVNHLEIRINQLSKGMVKLHPNSKFVIFQGFISIF